MRIDLPVLFGLCAIWLVMGCNGETTAPVIEETEIPGTDTPPLVTLASMGGGGCELWFPDTWCEEPVDDYTVCGGSVQSWFPTNIQLYCYCTNGSVLWDGECQCLPGYDGPNCTPEGDPWHDDGSDPDGDGPPIHGGGTSEADSVTVTLECPSEVAKGESAFCNLSKEPQYADISPIAWSFIGPDAPPNVATNTMEWGGVWAVSGRIDVSFRTNGKTRYAHANIEVTPRNWSWDGSYRTFRHEMSSDLDFCIASVGLTADVVSCNQGVAGTLFNPWQDRAGFDVREGTGPNAGVYFLDNPSKRMDVRTGLHPDKRPDGPTHSVLGDPSVVAACLAANPPITSANTHMVNTTCIPTQGFTDLVNHAGPHEGRHIAAAQAAAQDPENDFLPLWEIILATSEADAKDQARDAFLGGGGNTIWGAAESTHGSDMYFTYYYYWGSGVWEPEIVKVAW